MGTKMMTNSNIQIFIAFLCGHQGFVQFGNPHLLLAMLSWQHPELGCWTTKRAEPVPDFGMKAAIKFEHLRGFKMAKHEEKESRKEGGQMSKQKKLQKNLCR